MSSSHEKPEPGRDNRAPYLDAVSYHRKKKKKEEEEEAHSELNLTAMIDMMTILLVFLLKSYSVSTNNIDLKNLTLPRSTSPEAIVDATKVTITTSAILVDEKPVPLPTGGKLSLANTPQGPMFPKEVLDPSDDHHIPALQKKLEESAERQRKVLERQKRELHSKILIIADARVPFITVAQVIRTVGLVTIDLKNPDGSPMVGADGKPVKDGWFDEFRFVVVTAKKE